MALNGIDISGYQGDLDLGRVSYDFVMIKATEGVSYINPACDRHYQQAKAQGKKLAVYHYANGNDATAEANFFVDTCEGYIREAIFVLDWEGEGVEFTAWALTFLQRVEARIGYKPAIYMSEYVVNSYDWSAVVANGNGLIAAKYSDYEIDNDYDMDGAGTMPDVKWWNFYFMWQWTSKGHLNGYAGDLDCDIAYITPEGWDRYAGVPVASPLPEPTTTTTTAEIPIPVHTATTTTTQPAPPDEPTTTTTTVVTEQPVSIWVAIWAAFIALMDLLKGKKK